MKVSKWGNSLAVRLPKKLTTQMNLQDGDSLQFEVTTGGFKLTSLRQLLQEQSYENTINFKFNREEANER